MTAVEGKKREEKTTRRSTEGRRREGRHKRWEAGEGMCEEV